MNTLNIRIVDGPEKAPNYKGGDFMGARLKEAVIVLDGTTAGKPTVDLVFEIVNERGEVTGLAAGLTTGEIIKGLASAITGAEQR